MLVVLENTWMPSLYTKHELLVRETVQRFRFSSITFGAIQLVSAPLRKTETNKSFAVPARPRRNWLAKSADENSRILSKWFGDPKFASKSTVIPLLNWPVDILGTLMNEPGWPAPPGNFHAPEMRSFSKLPGIVAPLEPLFPRPDRSSTITRPLGSPATGESPNEFRSEEL